MIQSYLEFESYPPTYPFIHEIINTLTLSYRKTFNCTRGYNSFLEPLGAGNIQGRVLLKGGYNFTVSELYPQKVPKKH